MHTVWSKVSLASTARYTVTIVRRSSIYYTWVIYYTCFFEKKCLFIFQKSNNFWKNVNEYRTDPRMISHLKEEHFCTVTGQIPILQAWDYINSAKNITTEKNNFSWLNLELILANQLKEKSGLFVPLNFPLDKIEC